MGNEAKNVTSNQRTDCFPGASLPGCNLLRHRVGDRVDMPDLPTKFLTVLLQLLDGGCLMRRPLQPRSRFFIQQPILEDQLGHDLFQCAGTLRRAQCHRPSASCRSPEIPSTSDKKRFRTIPSRRHSSAILSSPRRPERTMRRL